MGFWVFICLGVVFVLFMITFLYFTFKKNFVLKKKSKSEPYEVPQEILEKVKGKNGVMLDCGSEFNTKLIEEIYAIKDACNLNITIVFDYYKQEYQNLIADVEPIEIKCLDNDIINLYKIVDKNDNKCYTFYFLSNKHIYANPSSSFMFAHGRLCGAHSIKTIKFNNFNTSEVQLMLGMFVNCENIESLDLRGFDTSNIYEMSCLFAYCSSLTNVNFPSLNTNNIINMRSQFIDGLHLYESECTDLEEIDLNGSNTQNVIDMEDMFYGCTCSLCVTIDKSDTKNVKSADSMSEKCDNLKNTDLIILKSKDD